MAISEVLAVERLGIDAVAGGLALSDGAGWNQSADDWAFFIGRGATFGIRDEAGRLVATASALPCDGGVGWISMVLVDPAHRHRGHATTLLQACVDQLRGSGRLPLLDATPAGAEVYRRSGFIAGFAFERWEGSGGDGARDREGATGCAEARRRADQDVVVALDAAAGRVGREPLLRELLARPATRAWLPPAQGGFAIARAGRRATQIGPIVAARTEGALDLLETALAACAGPAFIDVPVTASTFARRLERHGFVRQRSFVRMALGATPLLTADARVFALAGPEFG